MKHFLVGLLGFLLGTTVAAALLYFNPLTGERAPAPSLEDRTLRYALPSSAVAFTRGDFLPGTFGDPELWEATIDRTALLGLVLEDAVGTPIAVASRLIAASPETDLLLKGVLVRDHWLLSIPGEGTLYVRADSNVWPFLKKGFIPSWVFGRPWTEPVEFRPTAGPGPRHTAVAIGVTGQLASLRGRALETYRVTTLDRERNAVSVVSALHLDLPQEPLAVSAQ